ncbi:DUF982 domain-containing protein [Neorhizobium sp. T25_27]|uniref:DUF982 domain-containing protein n=1 Tax=Neorhizobium sp. T25_27 TaxID=2093831 RepID=UPI00352DF439
MFHGWEGPVPANADDGGSRAETGTRSGQAGWRSATRTDVSHVFNHGKPTATAAEAGPCSCLSPSVTPSSFPGSAKDAAWVLADEWPPNRGRREAALRLCLAALKGQADPEQARFALLAAAREADIPIIGPWHSQ